MRAKRKASVKPRGTSSQSPATADRKVALLAAARKGAFIQKSDALSGG